VVATLPCAADTSPVGAAASCRRAEPLADVRCLPAWRRAGGGFLALALSLAATGCTWQTAYNAGQQWQRNACNRLPDSLERERCLRSADLTYDDYRNRVDAKTKP
jgi:hypothetical protein